MMSMKKSKLWGWRLVAVGVSVGLVLVALEIGLRVRSGGRFSTSLRELFMPDDAIGYRLRPNTSIRYRTREFDTHISTNSLGLRDDEIDPKPAGEFRILLLGDSMTLAVQVPVERTFAQQLERRLNEDDSAPLRYRVINGGVQGYGTVEQFLFYSQFSDVVEPDLVILMVYAGNDATDAADTEHRLLQSNPSMYAGRTPVTRPNPGGRFGFPLWLRRLSRRSLLVQFTRTRVLALLGPSSATPVRDRSVESYLADPPADVRHGFAVAAEAAAEIIDLAGAREAATAMVLLPARFQVNAEEFARLESEFSARGRLKRDSATDRFRAVLQGLPAPLFNVLPAFRDLESPERLYFERNSHLTAHGHEALSLILEAFLRSEHLLGEP